MYYTLNDQQVVREVVVSTKPRTPGQLKAQKEVKVCAEFLKSVKAFIETGFSAEARGTTSNPFNKAMKYNRSTVVKGVDPDLSVDFSKVMLSKGDLKPVDGVQVSETTAGLRYSWDADPQMDWPEATDQAMMLAYFPEQQKAIYTLFSTSRLSGSSFLELPPSLRGRYMETYLAFVSADRKAFSDSMYTGKFNSGEVIALLTEPKK